MDAQTLGTSPPFPADFNHDEDQDFKTNSSKQNSNVIHNNSKQNDCGIEICPTSRRPSTIGSLGTVQGGGLPSARYLENEIVTKHLDSRKHLTANDVGLCELILLTSFNLSYGFICGTFALWILPSEARRLFPLFQSLTLGLSLGIVGVTQLVSLLHGIYIMIGMYAVIGKGHLYFLLRFVRLLARFLISITQILDLVNVVRSFSGDVSLQLYRH